MHQDQIPPTTDGNLYRKSLSKYIIAIFALMISTDTHAEAYGTYDPMRILTTSQTVDGKKYNVDVTYLDQILNDLANHAKNYPPEFDTTQDRARALQDVMALSGALDILIAGSVPDSKMLARAGFLNSMGHNLDIKGCAQKANTIFQRLLMADPSNPEGNYMYGNFLAGVGHPKEAVAFLEKALIGGITDANYSLGMNYVQLGDRDKAVENLEAYRRRHPSDETVKELIDGIRSGKVQPMSEGPAKP